LASSDEARYIWFSLGHSKTNVTANIETISGFSFDGHQVGKPRFAKIGRGSLGSQVKNSTLALLVPPGEGLVPCGGRGKGLPVEKDWCEEMQHFFVL